MSFTRLRYHVTFGTKDRRPLITKERESTIWEFLETCCEKNDGILVEIGGTSDHVHLLPAIPPDRTVEKFVKEVKRQSSICISEEISELSDFCWQKGFGALTVSKWDMSDLIGYIRDQKQLHRRNDTLEQFEHIE